MNMTTNEELKSLMDEEAMLLIYSTADVIEPVLDAEPDKWWTPSAVARKAKITTSEAGRALAWMDEHNYVKADGNGCWRKFSSRRRSDGGWK